MHRYIHMTDDERSDMLSELGAGSVEELFNDIPASLKLNRKLNLPDALNEMELSRLMNSIAAKNVDFSSKTCFLGAGVYDHYVPAAIDHMLLRSEFYTAYTPYQPEVSQGTLQAIFEFQTLICALTGMDAANASVYDGATAVAEAALMATAIKPGKKVLILDTVNPEYVTTCRTYCRFKGIGAEQVSDDEDFTGAAAVIVQSPNFFGEIEDLSAIAEKVKKEGALFIVSTDPISLGLLKPPGEYGADIVVGEGQALGSSVSYGGPGLGFFAVKKEHMRKMPGRIVGLTNDANGREGYVLTMQAREQHIRRDKATSNICSNHALNALAATIYLTLKGADGLRETAMDCLEKSHYLYDKLMATGKFQPYSSKPFFKEFALMHKSCNVSGLNEWLMERGFIGGYDLGMAGVKGGWLVAVTEKRTKEEMDEFAERAAEYDG